MIIWRKGRCQKIGQSILEYSVLIAIVAAAFLAMALYVKRAVQGKIYRMEEQVSPKSVRETLPGGFS